MAKSTPLYLVVDTNIILSAFNESKAEAYARLLDDYRKQHYSVCVNDYVRYEVARSSDSAGRDRWYHYLDNNYTRIKIHPIIFEVTTRLAYLYSKHKTTKSKTISDCDIMNAAIAAMLKGCPIMTMDGDDYPRCFFLEKDRHYVEYTSKKGRQVVDIVYILEPDLQALKRIAEEVNGR